MVLRQTSLTDDATVATVSFLAQEEKSLDSEVVHAGETVTGLAFESAGVLTGFEADNLLFA